MAEPKPLIIEAPRQGIAQSPHIGFGNVRNLDIYSVPGVAKLNNILAKVSSTNVTATVKWIVRDPVTVANFYAVDSAGTVYVSTNSGASFAALGSQPSSAGAGQGLAIWKDYLWCPRATAMDLYGPLSGSPSWTNAWSGLTMDTDSLWHPLFVSELDDKLYGGAGRYIFSISEDTGETFAPATSTTYTATARALTLPANIKVKCLAELSNNLMIGTWKGTNIYDFNSAIIYPWDGSSITYNQPIFIKENGVNAMLSDNGSLYILAGIGGLIYKSNGIQAWPIGKIPLSVSDISGGKYLEPYPGAIMTFKGKLYFALSSSTTSGKIVSDGIGIYSLYETGDENILNLEHFISSESTGSANATVIGALLPISRDQFLCGWRDNTTYGIDLLSTTSFSYSTSYSGYFESPLYQVGTFLNRKPFSQIEFYLAKELAASEGIRVKFRINLTDSWTTIGTYTTSNIRTGEISFNDAVNIPACENLQIRCELLGTSTTTPELLRIILT
jgi:hypothetical protein